MNKKEFTIRFLMLILGLFIMALGIVLTIKANLGTPPISCLPYVLSIILPFLTIGEWTIVFHSFLLLLQILILKRDFDLKQLSQILVLVFFGYIIDFILYLCSFINPITYISQWICCLMGIVVLAFGVFLEVYSNLVVVPPDGFVQVVSEKLNKEFGKIKPFFDSIMVILAIILGFVFYNQLLGVREGTVVAAIFIGILIKYYKDYLGKYLDKFLN